MDVPVLESCPSSRTSAHVPYRLVGDRMLDSTMALAAREQIDSGPRIAPVHAQRIEQPGAEHDVTVLASLAALYMDNHALAINIADLERGHLCAAASGRIECHEHGTLKGCPGRLDQMCDFFSAEHLRQALDLSRIRGSRPRSSFASTPGYKRIATLLDVALQCSEPASSVATAMPGTGGYVPDPVDQAVDGSAGRIAQPRGCNSESSPARSYGAPVPQA